MADNKRYYWLKLKDDFFEDDTISWLQEQENGKDYVIFYLKLALKSLTDNGSLIRYVGEKLIPYDIKALSKLTDTPVDTVAVAMKTFEQIGLISVSDVGEIYLNQINELIGSETDVAKRVRKHRAKVSIGNDEALLLQSNTDVTKSNTDIRDKSIELEIDKDKEIRKKTTTKKFVKPTLDELNEFVKQNNYSIDINYFLDYYESKGWLVGKSPMKDWKATVRNWERRNKKGEKIEKDIGIDGSEFGLIL